MKILDLIQGSPEWHQARTGMPSASQFKNIVTCDGKTSKSRQKYLYQLAGERITGTREESYQNAAMSRGIELEPEARNLFLMLSGVEVEEVGMCVHDSGLFSCSPDGLNSTLGLEIKCPSMAVHVEYLLKGRVPPEYYQQVHGSMLVTGFDSWYFMSYMPGMKPLIHLEKRNDEFCDALHAALIRFSNELEETINELR
jgi:exodeoxyribonuclease (lambda-induced)